MQSGQAWTNTKSGRYVACATAALTCTAANGGMYETINNYYARMEHAHAQHVHAQQQAMKPN